MDQNQRRARQINMRKGRPLPARPSPLDATEETAAVSYFIQSRPAPGQPWQQSGLHFSWQSKAKALEKLAARREMQSTWEHRLMERRTTVTEQPATQD